MIVVGTSLNVYPAAGLIYEVRQDIPIYLVDPSEVDTGSAKLVKIIKSSASEGLTMLVSELLKNNKLWI